MSQPIKVDSGCQYHLLVRWSGLKCIKHFCCLAKVCVWVGGGGGFKGVKIRLSTKNQLPRLPGNALTFEMGGGVDGPTNYFVTPNMS
jgi:hypothetical protein